MENIPQEKRTYILESRAQADYIFIEKSIINIILSIIHLRNKVLFCERINK